MVEAASDLWDTKEFADDTTNNLQWGVSLSIEQMWCSQQTLTVLDEAVFSAGKNVLCRIWYLDCLLYEHNSVNSFLLPRSPLIIFIYIWHCQNASKELRCKMTIAAVSPGFSGIRMICLSGCLAFLGFLFLELDCRKWCMLLNAE